MARQADLLCLAVSISKINPSPVSRRLWLQNELLELHPVAKVWLNSWFPDHKLKIGDLPSLNLLLFSLYILCPWLNPKLAVSAGIFWELKAVSYTERIHTFPYCMISMWIWSIFIWNFSSVQEPVLTSSPWVPASTLTLSPFFKRKNGRINQPARQLLLVDVGWGVKYPLSSPSPSLLLLLTSTSRLSSPPKTKKNFTLKRFSDPIYQIKKMFSHFKKKSYLVTSSQSVWVGQYKNTLSESSEIVTNLLWVRELKHQSHY